MVRFLVLLLFALLLSCSGSKEADATQDTRPAPPSDFQLEIGEGGGFTGMWTGYALDSTGSVAYLSGRRLGEKRSPLGSLDRSTMSELWHRIDSSRVLAYPPPPSPGNMTRAMIITVNGKTTHLSWGQKSNGQLDDLYESSMTLIRGSLRR